MQQQNKVSSIENEQEFEVLSFMVKSSDNVKAIIEYGVKPDWFLNEHLFNMFGNIVSHYNKFGSLYTKQQHMEQIELAYYRGIIKDQDVIRLNDNFYDQLLNANPDDNDLKPKLEAFKKTVLVYKASQLLRKYGDAINDGDIENAQRALVQGLTRLENNHGSAIGKPKNIAELCKKVIKRKPGDLTFITTGINELDENFSGFRNKSFSGLAAAMGTGKTTMGMQLCRHAAKQKMRTCFISLEIDEIEIAEKFVIQECDSVSIKDIWKCDINDNQATAIHDSSSSYMEYLDIIKPDKTTITPHDLHSIFTEGKYDFVVIDHQMRFAYDFSDGNASSGSLGLVGQQLKDMAKEYNLAILLLCQVNRNANKQVDKYNKEIKIEWDNIAGSNRLMDVMDNCFALTRKEDNTSELTCLKVRYGAKFDPIRLEFDAHNETFMDSNSIGYKDNTDEIIKHYWNMHATHSTPDHYTPVDAVYNEFCKYAVNYWAKTVDEIPTSQYFGRKVKALYGTESKSKRVGTAKKPAACYVGFEFKPVILRKA